MKKSISGWIIGASLAGAAGLAMADSTTNYYGQSNVEPRNGYVYDNYAGYAPDEASMPVKTEAPGVETVNRGGQTETAWQSNDDTWFEKSAQSTSAGPELEVNVGDPDVAQVYGRG